MQPPPFHGKRMPIYKIPTNCDVSPADPRCNRDLVECTKRVFVRHDYITSFHCLLKNRILSSSTVNRNQPTEATRSPKTRPSIKVLPSQNSGILFLSAQELISILLQPQYFHTAMERQVRPSINVLPSLVLADPVDFKYCGFR